MADHAVKEKIDVTASLASIRKSIESAQNTLEDVCYPWRRPSYGDEGDAKKWAKSATETAFIELIALAESLNLESIRRRAEEAFDEALSAGLNNMEQDSEGDLSITCHFPLYRFIHSIEGLFGIKSRERFTIQRDLIAILRATQYAITDAKCFDAVPKDEAEVHVRIEATLRCVFSDLRNKPMVSKPIKNFEPDTGIPSLRTLIEYKFVSSQSEVKRVVDEILADTRGYVSAEWDSFLYLIYETTRLRKEQEWRDLLRACGTAENTEVIVICGEPPAKTK